MNLSVSISKWMFTGICVNVSVRVKSACTNDIASVDILI